MLPSHSSNADQTILWHLRVGIVDKLVQGLDCTLSDEIDFCETCVQGKQERASFKTTSSKSITRLELVHSDECTITWWRRALPHIH